jgi:predicted nucleic-acid-binding protein
MIGIDTDIVLRYLLKDDLAFARRRQDDRAQHRFQN